MKQDDLAKAVNECLNTDLPFNTDFIDIMNAMYEYCVDMRDDAYGDLSYEKFEGLMDAIGELVPSTYGDDQ